MDLMKFENEVKMTSLDIAEITGKQHSHIMRDIRQEIENIGEEGLSIFGQSSYVNAQNKEQPCYKFGKKGAMQLALKYDAVTRYKVIEKIEELENASKPKIPNFNNPAEAARAWADQFEEAEKQKCINLQNKPKVEFYETVTESDDTMDMGTVAKIINKKGFGRNNLFKFLKENAILMQDNSPYQRFVNLKYFKRVELSYKNKKGESKISVKTVATQKGVNFILKLIDRSYNAKKMPIK